VNKWFLIVVLALTMIVTGCGEKKEQAAADHPAADHPGATAGTESHGDAAGADVWRGTVVETMDAGGYTYVLLDMGDQQRWVAGPEATVAVGDKLITGAGMEMQNFKSNAMDRTFEVIWFVGSFEPDDGHTHASSPASASPQDGDSKATGMGGGMGGMGGGASQHMTTDDAGVQGVEPVAGGLTVAQVYARAADLTDKTIKVRGRVVKFSRNIMGTNWLHIQDGTGSEGNHDLTITTEATAQIGDLVLIEGPVSVDRDFGAGYRYSVIMEGAAVTVE